MRIPTTALAALALMALQPTQAAARDTINVVGSSTLYPFTTVVAERFGRGKHRTPRVESTGTGGGFKLFCAGIGPLHPDAANASRPIKQSERERCNRAGITNIIELKVGYDGIVVAGSIASPRMRLSRRQLFLALAARVPDADGRLVPNPHKKWSDIDRSLPDRAIEVLGPPPTSGTRDAFVELAMEAGARSFDRLAQLRGAQDDGQVRRLLAAMGLGWDGATSGKKMFQAIAHAIREDGAYIEAGENDNLIVQKLRANPSSLGIFGYSFLEQNADLVHGSLIEGVEPEFEAIASGAYLISRPLFIYIKGEHLDLVPGLGSFVREYSSERAWGDEGYLSDRGLIPMPPAERRQYAESAAAAMASP